MIKSLSFLAIALGIVAPPLSAFAATELTYPQELRQKLGLVPYAGTTQGLSGLKVAILDNGFAGYLPKHGQLPDSTELITGPQNAQSPTEHGLGMAEIVWAMTGKLASGPKFYLVNTNGFTNFKAAVDFVVSEHVDIVLYSQVWSFGSNFDGTGFINAAVNRATRAGILWINAAGNFGSMVYSSSVAQGVDRDIRFKNRVDENELTVTLSWTDFQDSEAYNTTKDLDLLIFNSKNKLVGSSELIQRGEAPPATGDSQLSSHARETVTLRGLDRGDYRIRVRMQSGGFVNSDSLRIVLQSEKPGSIEFTDHTVGNEIFAPADNASVITVGEAFEASSIGPTADSRVKPDVLIPDAIVSFSNGTTVRGSSSAAALFTGVVCVLKSARLGLSKESLMTYLRELQTQAGSREGLKQASPSAWPPLPAEVTALVPTGGSLMIHPNGHFVIMTPIDPLELPQFRAVHAQRQQADDVMVLIPSEKRWLAIPKAQAPMIHFPLVEFRLSSATPGMWRTPSPAELRGF